MDFDVANTDFAPAEGADELRSGLERQAGVMASEDISGFDKAAQRGKRSVVRADSQNPINQKPLTQIVDEEGFAALAPGVEFIDPEGQKRKKPYSVASDADFEKVPEGEQFLDPEGQVRQKPKYEGINFTTQTLHDMALTPKEKRKILEGGYPGKKVDQDYKGELFVEDEGGVLRKAGRGDFMGKRGAAAVTAAAAPTVGAVLGTIGGGAVAAPTGPGAVAGAVAGGASGGVLGQWINDIVLQLAGYKDRTGGEEAANLSMAGLTGGMGAGVGRGVAAVVPTIKEGITAVGQALPRAAVHFLGADPAGTTMARELAEKGVMVPPSAWAKEAPHLQNVVEVFDPAFRTQAPLAESAAKHYEKAAGEVLDTLGIKRAEPLLKPTADVPTQPAGEAVLAKTIAESQAADEAMRVALEARRADNAARKAAVQSGLPETGTQREALNTAAEQSRAAAQKLIDAGFSDIQREIDAAMKVSGAGHNSGDLWWGVGEKLKAIKQGISHRAQKFYGQADEAAEGQLPNTQGLAPLAKDFADNLPEPFKAKYPDIVRRLEDLAGKQDPQTGEWIKPPVSMTFGQLHNLRSIFRNNINYHDLTPDMRDGVYKFFANKVDNILHDPKASPQLQTASQLLDATDKWYGEAIKPLTDKNIQAVVSGLESGMPADPKLLYATLVKEGRSDLTGKVKELIGPNLWSGVKAADVQEMLDMSKTLIPGQIDGAQFARQVLDRYRTGMLQAVHGEEMGNQLLRQAQNIAALNGKLDVKVLPGDTVTDVISKARIAGEEAKRAGATDPLGTLNKEMKTIVADHNRQLAKMQQDRNKDPLGFLYKPTTGADEAVNKILGSEDLILASAHRFGEKSPEFNMLRQVYAQRILQGSMDPSVKLANVSPEIQQVMFPGISLPQMQQLAKEMEFLVGSQGLNKGTAQGMSAMSKVENPWAHIAGRGGGIGKLFGDASKIVPGSGPAGRAWLTKYYSVITSIMTSPATLRWVEKGLTGTPEQRAAVQKVLSAHMQRGAAVGAGAGEAAYQRSQQ